MARAEAARAEQDAAQAQQGVQVEEARVEDRVRAADDVDPDVDTRSDDYRPDDPHDRPRPAAGDVRRPDDRTVTDVTGRPLDDSATDPEATRSGDRTTGTSTGDSRPRSRVRRPRDAPSRDAES